MKPMVVVGNGGGARFIKPNSKLYLARSQATVLSYLAVSLTALQSNQ